MLLGRSLPLPLAGQCAALGTVLLGLVACAAVWAAVQRQARSAWPLPNLACCSWAVCCTPLQTQSCALGCPDVPGAPRESHTQVGAQGAGCGVFLGGRVASATVD